MKDKAFGKGMGPIADFANVQFVVIKQKLKGDDFEKFCEMLLPCCDKENKYKIYVCESNKFKKKKKSKPILKFNEDSECWARCLLLCWRPFKADIKMGKKEIAKVKAPYKLHCL